MELDNIRMLRGIKKKKGKKKKSKKKKGKKGKKLPGEKATLKYTIEDLLYTLVQ